MSQPLVPQTAKDLARARENPSFNVTAMAWFLHGGADMLERRENVEKVLVADPIFSKKNRCDFSFSEKISYNLILNTPNPPTFLNIRLQAIHEQRRGEGIR